jgi:hypothetical protein
VRKTGGWVRRAWARVESWSICATEIGGCGSRVKRANAGLLEESDVVVGRLALLLLLLLSLFVRRWAADSQARNAARVSSSLGIGSELRIALTSFFALSSSVDAWEVFCVEGRLVRMELMGFVDAEAGRVATVFTNAVFDARSRRGVAESSVEAAKKRRGWPGCSSIYSHNWQTGLGRGRVASMVGFIVG